MRAISVGIDVSVIRGLDVVAMGRDRQVIAVHSRVSPAGASQLVDELQPAVVCIDSPAQWSTSGTNREAERALSRLGINAFPTPSEDRQLGLHAWMKVGFATYDALADRYPRYRGGDVTGTAAEYFPHASAVVLAGHIAPFRSKLAFRRKVLEENGVVTSSLRTIDQVDAALGALTGLIALDGGHCWVGDADEGALLLPISVLPERLLRVREDALVKATVAITRALDLSDPSHPLSSRGCGCGCGAPVRREFLPGHDVKLRSRLLKQAVAGASATAELARRHWA